MAELESITIQGETFHAEPRYNEGDTLNANEAGALNQTFFENLRNNFANKVKEAKEAGTFVLEELQKSFEEYTNRYQFGVRTGGGGGGTRRDPVLAEAISIALEKIKEAIKRAGANVSDYDAKDLRVKAKELAERTPDIMELARERVKENQAVASDSLDAIMGSLAKAPAPAEKASPSEAPTEAAAA